MLVLFSLSRNQLTEGHTEPTLNTQAQNLPYNLDWVGSKSVASLENVFAKTGVVWRIPIQTQF